MCLYLQVEMMKRDIGSCLKKTVTAMLRRLMTRELAMKFSMTGTGKTLKHKKLCFRDTEACLAIERKY